jgi:dihydroorotate dehydrogenase
MYKLIIRKLLFLFEPELIHNLIVFFLKIPLTNKLLRLFYYYDHTSLRRNFFGLTFKNPVGLAAGFDKDAELVSQIPDLGFGFIEIGTVTPLPQPGNPQARIFRLVRDQALINRMGFNNRGVEGMVKQLRNANADIVIAGNIGKNKITPNEKAADDYLICFDALFDYVDLFVVNVSSPNTPHLRELQDKVPLTNLLKKLQERNQSKPGRKPILLKIAPDLSDTQLDDIIGIVTEVKLDGIVATNTTISRERLKTEKSRVEQIGEGGLSGLPLKDKSTRIIKYIHEHSGGKIPIIGVGGIHSAEDACEKLNAGASLIELYTGFIYDGPGLVKRINKELVRRAGDINL